MAGRWLRTVSWAAATVSLTARVTRGRNRSGSPSGRGPDTSADRQRIAHPIRGLVARECRVRLHQGRDPFASEFCRGSVHGGAGGAGGVRGAGDLLYGVDRDCGIGVEEGGNPVGKAHRGERRRRCSPVARRGRLPGPVVPEGSYGAPRPVVDTVDIDEVRGEPDIGGVAAPCPGCHAEFGGQWGSPRAGQPPHVALTTSPRTASAKLFPGQAPNASARPVASTSRPGVVAPQPGTGFRDSLWGMLQTTHMRGLRAGSPWPGWRSGRGRVTGPRPALEVRRPRRPVRA